MRSLCITRAPTVSLPVPPPGGVPSLTGLTAVAVPTCCASAGPAAISAAASGAMMNLTLMTHSLECLASKRSANDRQLPADHVGAAGLNQWRGAEIELPDMRKHTDNQDKTCAQKADDQVYKRAVESNRKRPASPALASPSVLMLKRGARQWSSPWCRALSERHGRDGAADFVRRPKGNRPGRGARRGNVGALAGQVENLLARGDRHAHGPFDEKYAERRIVDWA